MKIFILNSSGNVGKSLLARELFYPRLEDALILEIETVNSGSAKFPNLNIDKFRATDDFSEIYMRILGTENVIVDVGASNLSAFWEAISEFAGVGDLFDIFVVPSRSTEKIQTDTYKTIDFLRSEGINDERIKVIFNDVKKSVDSEFEMILNAPFPFDTSLYIRSNVSLYNDLGFLRKTISDIYTPDIESYKSKILLEKEPKEKLALVKADLANRQAQKIKGQMDSVFEGVTGSTPIWIGESTLVEEKPLKAKPAGKKKDEESPVNIDDEEL